MSRAIEKPQRADAVRNRERVMDAARSCFGADGLDTQMEELAKRAGVGVGTVYRHFPTKDAVVKALAEDHFVGIAGIARGALEIDDPWEAFESFMWQSAEALSQNLAVAQCMTGAMAREAIAQTDLWESTAKLIERAQKAGVMRADATGDDVSNIMCGISNSIAPADDQKFLDWPRLMQLVLDGLRLPSPRP